MSGLRLTDAQISKALHVHLPERAQAGLRERVLEAAETTAQQRALPSFLGALSDPDPVARRRSLLVAAALLVALAISSAAAVGALRLLDSDPVKQLSLEPPADVPAFVLSVRDEMRRLPPVAITTLDSAASKGRIYVDRSGAVRFERYASTDAIEPVKITILSGNRSGGTETVGSDTVWLENDEAIGEDPRAFILSEIGYAPMGLEGPGCEMTRDPSEAGNSTAATGWRYVGVEYVAGRPAHHVACGGDLWIDIETHVILRSRGTLLDGDRQPIPGAFRTFEVTEIAFGEQPAALFAFVPPEGVARMSNEAYLDLCGPDTAAFTAAYLEGPPCSGTPRPADVTPTPEPSPTPIVRPNPSDCTVPSGDPGDPAGPLAWTQASLKEDWPAPVRPEPAGGASVLPMPLTHIDPSGDTGSDVLPCADIRDLMVGTYGVFMNLFSNPPRAVEPTEQWMAYGVVVDEDGDGMPDWRYGIDNMPVDAAGERPYRAWRTDLHTGRTERVGGPGYDYDGEVFFETSYPRRDSVGADARFSFGARRDVAGVGMVTTGTKMEMPFYAWASVIQDGRVVATDYAPDAGWLLPSPGAKPGGTYVLDDAFPLRISINVADGWTVERSLGDRGFVDNGGVALSRDSGKTGISFLIVDNLAVDSCGDPPGTIDPLFGPTVDDLVTFLEGLRTVSPETSLYLPLIEISEKADVTLDGYRGKYLEYTKTARDTGGCREVQTHSQVWILDAKGVRLVIDAFSEEASETIKAEFRQIVESIEIEP